MVQFLVGVDGGGSGTRVRLARPDGTAIGRGAGGPSALRLGAAAAWLEIERATTAAFADAGLPRAPWSACAVGAGLSGVNHAPWRDAFVAADPGCARLVVDTDACTMLLGAHGGRPGALVAAGTGSVGEALHADGRRVAVGGWGFPIGDEGSGAWLGWRAVQHTMHAVDGRARHGALARGVQERCGGDADALIAWVGTARTADYAALAPMVFALEADDTAAAALLGEAAEALAGIARALDPDGTLPLAVSGSIGERLAPRLPPALQARRVAVVDSAEGGALVLLKGAA